MLSEGRVQEKYMAIYWCDGGTESEFKVLEEEKFQEMKKSCCSVVDEC